MKKDETTTGRRSLLRLAAALGATAAVGVFATDRLTGSDAATTATGAGPAGPAPTPAARTPPRAPGPPAPARAPARAQ
ncbi:polysaccharide deacetylase family protein, partial [Streptomyces sp. NPDC003943]